MHIEIVEGLEELARRAADAVCALVRQKPDAVLGLASGATPRGLYAELARRGRDAAADFGRVTAFAVDELHGVPKDHPATNVSYFREQLTQHVPLRALHVMDSGAADAEAECVHFGQLIEEAGGLDLVVLGIGRNGHLAFNEPGSPFDSRARRVALAPTTREPYAQHFGSLDATPAFGLTLGMEDLLAPRDVLLLASGADKAEVVARTLQGPVAEALPASALRRHPRLTVLLDEDAAAQLRQGPS